MHFTALAARFLIAKTLKRFWNARNAIWGIDFFQTRASLDAKAGCCWRPTLMAGAHGHHRHRLCRKLLPHEERPAAVR